MTSDENVISNNAGIIPDFFHDIIAYILPGSTAIILIVFNYIIINNKDVSIFKDFDIGKVSVFLVISYVLGRFYEHLGYSTIHKIKFPSMVDKNKITSPKWELIFDENNSPYTKSFRENTIKKIQEWLKYQDGQLLVEQCKAQKKDDYFNLIQFYLRERFPAVALYEKKQNAQIILSRSLAIVFLLNIIVYLTMIFLLLDIKNCEFSTLGLLWMFIGVVFSYIFYKRFQQDKIYHGMYIFETFIATKKFLRTSNDKSD